MHRIFSPDGKHIVYVRGSVQADGKARNEIHTTSIDGSDDQAVALPPNAGIAYNWPTYSRDGKWIYFTALRADPQKQQVSEIHRVAVAGGETAKIIDDGRAADISPDGSKIVYMRFNYETFTAGLWIGDMSGENARELLNDQVFLSIAAPAFFARWANHFLCRIRTKHASTAGRFLSRANMRATVVVLGCSDCIRKWIALGLVVGDSGRNQVRATDQSRDRQSMARMVA